MVGRMLIRDDILGFLKGLGTFGILLVWVFAVSLLPFIVAGVIKFLEWVLF